MRIKYLIFICIAGSFWGCSVLSRKTGKITVNEQVLSPPVLTDTAEKITFAPPKKDSIVFVSISAVGDLMCHTPQVQNAKTDEGRYDFSSSFEYVKKYLSEADFTFGNLETTFAGSEKEYSGYPAFNSPDELIYAIKNAGFDLLGTANNHSMDTEEKGLLRTIEIVKKSNISYTGTFLSQKDRDSVRIFDVKGIKLGVLNYTYGTNGLLPAPERKYMLNVIDTGLIKSDIALARKQGSEIVLVFYHYGSESKSDPTDEQKNLIERTISYGADIIIGSHPHVISPVAFFKTEKAKLDSGFVAYSLGNFLSNQYWRYTDAGVILTLHLSKNFTKNSVYISSVEYLPTWVYRGTNPLKKAHIIFPAQYSSLDSIAPFIDEGLKKKMKEAFDDTKSMIGGANARILLKDVTAE